MASYQLGAFYWGEVGDGPSARSCFEETVAHWKRAAAEAGGKVNLPFPLLANAAENLMLLSLSYEEFDRWADKLRREAPQEPILHELVPEFQKLRDAGEPWSSVILGYALNYINPGSVAGAGAPSSGACLFQLLIENRRQLRLPLQNWRAAVLGYMSAMSFVLGRADNLSLKHTGRHQPGELTFVTTKYTKHLVEYCSENSYDQELGRLLRKIEDDLQKQAQRAGSSAANPLKATQPSALAAREPTKAEQFVFIAFSLGVGVWPFLAGAGTGWKILGAVALVLGAFVLLAGFVARAARGAIDGQRTSRLDAAQIERNYRDFSDGCPRLGFRVIAVECDPFANATLLIRPSSPPDNPESVMSFLKARLFTLMPTALEGARHLRLEQHLSTSRISCRGKDFPEPAWFVSDGRVRVGPLGFRFPEWDEGKQVFEFTLMETSFRSAGMVDQMSSVAGSKASIVNEVAAFYRDRVGEFSL